MARRRSDPKDLPLVRAVAFYNPMAPPLVPRVLIDALPQLLENIRVFPGYGMFSGPTPYQRIGAALTNLSMVYTNLGKAQYIPQPDFTDPAFQCAYVFQYLVKHCHLVYQILWKTLPISIARIWLQRGVNVCSIGGGPGTDIIGVLVFLRSMGSYLGYPENTGRVMGYVLDQYGAWESTWSSLRSNNATLRDSQIYCSYITCDLLDELPTAATEDEIRQADLVTMIKSLSAFQMFLKDGRDIRHCAVTKLLRQLRRGAFVLFIDNKDEMSRRIFYTGYRSQNRIFLEDMAAPAGLRIVGEWHGKTTTRLEWDHHRCLMVQLKQFQLNDWKVPGLRTCDVSAFLLQKQ
ncbi:uncharacterized protein LOC117294358 [Asterias rubens]|uniref:uncharacterized protein LOC117294358 n=1 Tax=Asterias rubens TaxID=7604 RepID=UPI00145532DE|nr:uncharacterized protein LOC117294358 [Asterias rubens]XP_033632620.1 uncharacterized protein LOC117294358 [Asterias rubens]